MWLKMPKSFSKSIKNKKKRKEISTNTDWHMIALKFHSMNIRARKYMHRFCSLTHSAVILNIFETTAAAEAAAAN